MFFCKENNFLSIRFAFLDHFDHSSILALALITLILSHFWWVFFDVLEKPRNPRWRIQDGGCPEIMT